jgi:hypothetical protein
MEERHLRCRYDIFEVWTYKSFDFENRAFLCAACCYFDNRQILLARIAREARIGLPRVIGEAEPAQIQTRRPIPVTCYSNPECPCFRKLILYGGNPLIEGNIM